LTHGNISCILIIDQNICMVIANDNTHIVNQKMKLYSVNFFISSIIHVVCDLVACNLTLVIDGILVICRLWLKSSCKHQSQNLNFLLVIVNKITHLQDLNGRVINSSLKLKRCWRVDNSLTYRSIQIPLPHLHQKKKITLKLFKPLPKGTYFKPPLIKRFLSINPYMICGALIRIV
jgi:hypothetical protein